MTKVNLMIWTALSLEEKRGYSKFKEFGCIACHQGMNVGGNTLSDETLASLRDLRLSGGSP